MLVCISVFCCILLTWVTELDLDENRKWANDCRSYGTSQCKELLTEQTNSSEDMMEGRAGQSVAVASGLYSAGIWGHRGTPHTRGRNFRATPNLLLISGCSALRLNRWLHNWIWGFEDLGQISEQWRKGYFDLDDSTEPFLSPSSQSHLYLCHI